MTCAEVVRPPPPPPPRQVITELDEKKREALQVTWEKVNQDFGSIFSMLLPGTSAKLDPQEGHSFLDGEFPLDYSLPHLMTRAT